MTTTASSAPRTILEWVRAHRRRRRKQLGSEEAFRRHLRILLRMSAFTRHRGWKSADLEDALEVVEAEPIDEPVPDGQASGDAEGDRRDPPDRCARSPGSGRQCIDCASLLPAGRRRRGRCESCRQKRARETARHRMRRRRAKVAVGEAHQTPVEQRSGPARGAQSDDTHAGRTAGAKPLRS